MEESPTRQVFSILHKRDPTSPDSRGLQYREKQQRPPDSKRQKKYFDHVRNVCVYLNRRELEGHTY